MSETLESLRGEALVPDSPAAAALLIQPLLAKVAGTGTYPVSLTMDYGVSMKIGAPVRLEGWIVRMTRTLVFTQARIRTETGQLAVEGSAVFRRDGAETNANQPSR